MVELQDWSEFIVVVIRFECEKGMCLSACGVDIGDGPAKVMKLKKSLKILCFQRWNGGIDAQIDVDMYGG